MPHSSTTRRVSALERGARPPLRVGVILAHHFTLSAFAVFIDHLRLAADEGDRSRPLHVQWSIMASRPESVPASCGVLLEPTSALLSPELLDYVVVIGGILHAGPQIDEATARYLREVSATQVPLIGICTGSFILCRAGLMKGRRSCVSWYHYQDFLEAFPNQEVIADRLFLADGPRITCAGGAGAAALATYLIEQNLARPIAVAAVAAELGLSARQLERLCRQHVGMGPASLCRQLRMRYANWLIENTDRSVTDIANEAGFADCAHFSRQFKDTYGLSPSTRRLQPQRRIDGDAARARVFE